MKIILRILSGCVLFSSCHSESPPTCDLSLSGVTGNHGKKMIVTAKDDSTLEMRDVGKDTVAGGYYTFKNGTLQSYYFFTGQTKPYVPAPGDEVLEADSTHSKANFCSYAERYDSKGNLIGVIGVPLVYNYVKSVGSDSLSVTNKFFALNRIFEKVEVTTNTHFSALLKLSDDTLFTNMKTAGFQFNFGKNPNIEIYVKGRWRQNCSRKTKVFTDTIFLKYENGVLKNRYGN